MTIVLRAIKTAFLMPIGITLLFAAGALFLVHGLTKAAGERAIHLSARILDWIDGPGWREDFGWHDIETKEAE